MARARFTAAPVRADIKILPPATAQSQGIVMKEAIEERQPSGRRPPVGDPRSGPGFARRNAREEERTLNIRGIGKTGGWRIARLFSLPPALAVFDNGAISPA